MRFFINNIFIAVHYYTIAINHYNEYITIFKGHYFMKEINFREIGRKLKETRTSKGLTQEYIANMADVNTSHISNIENNRVKVSLPTLVHICNALNVTVDYILSEEYTDTSSVLDEEILRHLRSCTVKTKKQIIQIIEILK